MIFTTNTLPCCPENKPLVSVFLKSVALTNQFIGITDSNKWCEFGGMVIC